jgi:mono/diheme cytochrome c family protein
MKNFLGGILFTLVILILGGLLYIWSGSYNVSQLSPHASLTKWVITKTMMNSIKRRIKNIEVPDLNDSIKIATGAAHYDDMCAVCHLAPGMEESEIEQGLYPEPPEFTEKENIPDARGAFWIVQNGIKMTGMPAFSPTHNEEELWSMVAFLVKKMPGLTESEYNKIKESSPEDEH